MRHPSLVNYEAELWKKKERKGWTPPTFSLKIPRRTNLPRPRLWTRIFARINEFQNNKGGSTKTELEISNNPISFVPEILLNIIYFFLFSLRFWTKLLPPKNLINDNYSLLKILLKKNLIGFLEGNNYHLLNSLKLYWKNNIRIFLFYCVLGKKKIARIRKSRE